MWRLTASIVLRADTVAWLAVAVCPTALTVRPDTSLLIPTATLTAVGCLLARVTAICVLLGSTTQKAIQPASSVLWVCTGTQVVRRARAAALSATREDTAT
jgi:hypothetical protein